MSAGGVFLIALPRYLCIYMPVLATALLYLLVSARVYMLADLVHARSHLRLESLSWAVKALARRGRPAVLACVCARVP